MDWMGIYVILVFWGIGRVIEDNGCLFHPYQYKWENDQQAIPRLQQHHIAHNIMANPNPTILSILFLTTLLIYSHSQPTPQQPQQPTQPPQPQQAAQPSQVAVESQPLPQPQVVQPILATDPQVVPVQAGTGTGQAVPEPVAVEPIVVQPVPQAAEPVNTGTAQPTTPETPTAQPPHEITVNITPTPSNPSQPSQPSEPSPSASASTNPQAPTISSLNQPPRNPSQNYNYEPSPQLSARYKAEQERLNQMRRKQVEMEEEAARQREATQQKEMETYNRRSQERNRVRDESTPQDYAIPKKTVLFEIDRKIEEYYLNPITDTEITLRMVIYTLDNNAYGIVKDISTSGIIKAYVYEDNSRIVGQGEFYFQKLIKFSAKAKSTYVLRFYNEGIPKLVSLTYPNLLESSHIENLYSTEKRHLHLWKTQVLGLRIIQITERLRRNSMMDRINNETMMSFLMRYSGYQFVEMLVVVFVTGLQVHFVKKMFRTDSIL